MKEELNKYWVTENVGIGETKPVYDDFESTIKFHASRYVHLHLLNRFITFYPTNKYSIAKYRIYNSKKQDNDPDMKTEYDDIF